MGAFEAVISIVGVWVGGNHTFKVSKKQGQGVGFPMLLSSHPIPLPAMIKMCCSASMLCRPSTMSLQVRHMLSIP